MRRSSHGHRARCDGIPVWISAFRWFAWSGSVLIIGRADPERRTQVPAAAEGLSGAARRNAVALAWLLASVLSSALADGPLHEQIAELTRQISGRGQDPALYLRRGELNRLHEQRDAARADFQQAQKLSPADPEPLFRLGRLALDEDKPAEASKLLAQFTAVRASSAEGRFLLARALARSERFTEAVAQYHRAIVLSEERPKPEWYIVRCRAQLALTGDHSTEALAGLDEGLAKLGPLPSLQLLAIEIETRRKAFDAALRRLDTILAASERKELWLARRGDLLKLAGRFAEARAAYRSAGTAIDALPSRQQRALAMLELRRELEGRLAELPAAPESVPAP